MNGSILVIDSDVRGLQDISDILELEGYDMLRASSGVQGITLAQQHRPNLIICVSYLQDISPEEMTQQLRDNPQTEDIPLLVIIRNRGGAYAYSGYTNAFLSVPFDPKDLIEAVDHSIRKDDAYWAKRAEPLKPLPLDTPAINLSGKVILLFVANIGLQVMMQIMLKRTLCKVLEAKGQEMLDNLLDVETADLIIVDIDMHDRNPARLVSHIRSRQSSEKTPILILVPRMYADVVIQCLQAGANDYLPKPVLAYDLLAKVYSMLKPS